VDIKKLKIYALIVTYNNRYELLHKAVQRALEEGACKVVLVDNGSVKESYDKIKKLVKSEKRIKLIRFNDNKGSAGGFKKGLMFAKTKKDCEFIWLLDDDNVPEKGALKTLVNFWNEQEITNKKTNLALNSLRYYDYDFLTKTEKELQLKNVEKDILILNSFSYFSIDNLFSSIAKKFIRRKNNNKKFYELTNGAYGGLFIHKKVLDKGLPNEEFFVYFDDIEFTYRLHKSGVRIFLIPDSKITDIDKTLENSDVKTYFSVFKILANIKYMNKVKLSYGYRNRIILEKKYLTNNLFKYKLNKFLFLFVIYPMIFTLYFIRYGEVKNMILMKKAIKDGLKINF